MAGTNKEIAAFTKMEATFEKKHIGDWVIFKDGKLVGTYRTCDEASRMAVAEFGAGPYLLRQVGGPPAHLQAVGEYWT